MRFSALLLLPLLLLAAEPLSAEEEVITQFRSEVTVQPDSSLLVTERITLRALGREIKRGILRDFPTDYRDERGRRVRVGFEVLDVERNGRNEPYALERIEGGRRIRIGDADVFLTRGMHTYDITYRTTRQLGFFEEYDELYWNVTGNEWSFTIEQAEASVNLPPGVSALQFDAYTGPAGSRGKNFTVSSSGNQVFFRLTRALPPGSGLTVAVAWPKGFVTEPSEFEKSISLYGEPEILIMAVFALCLVLGYYMVIWWRVGRDPRAGVIVPLFDPPPGLSAAACRFIRRMGFDDRAFAAAVVSLAVKGFLRVVDEKGHNFTLERQTEGHIPKAGKTQTTPTPGEESLFRKLFNAVHSIELKQSNHARIRSAREALAKSLAREYGKVYFVKNALWFGVGLALSLGIVAALLVVADPGLEAIFFSVWLTIWTGGCIFLAFNVIRSWRAVKSRLFNVFGALFATAFAGPFFAAEGFVIVQLWYLLSPIVIFALVAIGALNIVFYRLLRAPTLAGRAVLDKIEGFRMYLSVAEKERLGVLHPPERTPELFERYLPYALALDVEHEWSEQFSDVLKRAGVESERGGYHPNWYSGRSLAIGDLSDRLGGGLASAVGASASPPGSSSGSGGGGSSGGGGGGGGGSGW